MASIVAFSVQYALRCKFHVICRIHVDRAFPSEFQRAWSQVFSSCTGHDTAYSSIPSIKDVVPLDLEKLGSFRNCAIDDTIRRWIKVFWDELRDEVREVGNNFG